MPSGSVRSVRAVRVSARLNFTIEHDTREAIVRHAGDLPGVSRERIGDEWITDLSRLRDLMRWVDDAPFLAELAEVKQRNKARLAEVIEETTGILVDPASIFDTHVKRIHMYKRQLLNVLHIVALYAELREGADRAPRTFIFGGKAAPGYWMAKLIVKLIHDVGTVVNEDERTRDRLKVVFVPNYGVSLAERIIPGSDVSEQISMSGKEASGTGNMKFAMNGALTIGTLDGANIEIREEVGEDNFFLFGHTAEQVRALDRAGYDPAACIARTPALARALEMIASGLFSEGDTHRYDDLLHELRGRDTYKHCADFASYAAAHRTLEDVYADPVEWQRRALYNIAFSGKFSSDRTIREYAKEIWGIEPTPVRLDWD